MKSVGYLVSYSGPVTNDLPADLAVFPTEKAAKDYSKLVSVSVRKKGKVSIKCVQLEVFDFDRKEEEEK